MRAVRCLAGSPVVVQAPEPSGEGIRVRVRSAGICGSDLHLLAWNLPVIMGHELAGTLPDGTPVAVEPIAACGTCRPCRDGDYNRCARGPATILGVGRDGGMADECLVPLSAVVPLPAGVATTDACLIEPLAVAVHGARRGRIRPDERVAVVGGGSIGQAAVVAVQAVGATVALEARHDRQREAAERLAPGRSTASTTWWSRRPARPAPWPAAWSCAAAAGGSSCSAPTGTATPPCRGRPSAARRSTCCRP